MGDNIYLGDRNGVRTPMQWSADRNAGFCRQSAEALPAGHYRPGIPLRGDQRRDAAGQSVSLLWWMKRLIALRKRFRGVRPRDDRFLYPENSKVLAFVREVSGRRVLLVAVNLLRLFTCAASIWTCRIYRGSPRGRCSEASRSRRWQSQLLHVDPWACMGLHCSLYRRRNPDSRGCARHAEGTARALIRPDSSGCPLARQVRGRLVGRTLSVFPVPPAVRREGGTIGGVRSRPVS